MEYHELYKNSEAGIYVVCSDKGLLDRINRMLKRNGVIGIADAEGKFHYFVDGRQNTGRTVTEVSDIVIRNAASIEEELPSDIVSSVLRTVLVFYDFDISLIGTTAIFLMVRKMVMFSDLYYQSTCKLYSMASEALKLSCDQIERDVRYSIKKSSFNKTGIKTSMILRMLSDEVSDRVAQIKRQPVS